MNIVQLINICAELNIWNSKPQLRKAEKRFITGRCTIIFELGSDSLLNLYILPKSDSIATISFPKYMDVLNYLSTLGWNLSSHSKDDIREDIIIKKEYNLEAYLKWKSKQ